MPIVLLISFSFIFTQRRQLIFLFIIDFLISAVFLVDLVYARAYGHLISFYMIFAKYVTEDLGAGIISLIKWTDFLMFIDLPLLVIFLIKSRPRYLFGNRTLYFSVTAALSIGLICFQFSHLENNKLLGNYKMQPLFMSPLGYHLFDLYRFIYEKGETLDQDEISRVDSWLESNAKYQEPDEDYVNLAGIAKGKNLIVIQFESLENILVDQFFYGQEIIPNINKLLDNSIYFNNIVEQVRDGNSSDAELLFNASMYPISNGSAFLRFGDNTYVTLPKLLYEQGYTSIAIHGDDKKFWNRDRVFAAFGFDKYISEEQFTDKDAVGMGISDRSLFFQSLTEIKKLPEPFNVFIITLTSHMPFKLNKEIRYLNLPDNDISEAYLQSIHYTDNVFGEFYNQLQAEGLLNNTVIVIYGDHEGIHKYYSTTLSDNNCEVPFIIHIPGLKGSVIDKVGGQVDMMPTLAYLLGIEKEKYSSSAMGRNMFGKNSGTALLATGEILGKADNPEHLTEASEIADMSIKGDYFKEKQ
jgi:phosphoglycerol transferase MdoB-like AlkP superfamily enzyme